MLVICNTISKESALKDYWSTELENELISLFCFNKICYSNNLVFTHLNTTRQKAVKIKTNNKLKKKERERNKDNLSCKKTMENY